jgi:hypothetical protein
MALSALPFAGSNPPSPSFRAPSASPPCTAHFAAAAAGRSGALRLACDRGWAPRRRRGGGLVVRASADYYVTLGVPRSASNKDIKAAYRKLARQVLDVSPLSQALAQYYALTKMSSLMYFLSFILLLRDVVSLLFF